MTKHRYLFVFGYESPEEWETNNRLNKEDESSIAIWVLAANEEDALRAGCDYAETYVFKLFSKSRIANYPGWTACNYAFWIETSPLERLSGIALDLIDEIDADLQRE